MDAEGPFQSLIEGLSERLASIGLHCEYVRLIGSVGHADEEDMGEDMDEDDVFSDVGDVGDGEEIFTEEAMIQRIKDGTEEFALAIRARTADLAWTDKVLKPDEYTAEQEFKSVGPSALEMVRESITQQLQDGVDPSDLDLDIFTTTLEDDEDEESEEGKEEEGKEGGGGGGGE